MGVRYHNITLQGVTQQELADYLAHVSLDCYISPTINGFTILYEMATLSEGTPHRLPEAIGRMGKLEIWMRQYKDPYFAVLVCLSSHLSQNFNCSVLSVFADEDYTFWYHLSRYGVMLDEYTTRSDPNWQPGRGIKQFSVWLPQGGNAYKLCSAFGQEDASQDVQAILDKPESAEFCKEEGEHRYSALLDMDSYDCLTRHEALARALGMRPCWVVGIDYLCCEGSGDFGAHYEDMAEDIDPPLDQAIQMIRHVT